MDGCSVQSPYPLAINHEEFMMNILKTQIEKIGLTPYGLEYDFYILAGHTNSGRHFSKMKVSVWSTIHWITQRDLAPLHQSWYNARQINQKKLARVCIVGDWSRMNSYPTFLYDKIKEMAESLGITPTVSNIIMESEFFKPPFGRAFNPSQLWEKDKNVDNYL